MTALLLFVGVVIGVAITILCRSCCDLLARRRART